MAQSPSPDSPAAKTLAEHRALHALLEEIERASDDTRTAANEIKPRLDTLRDQLAAHFEGEEEGGLFEQIMEEAPEQAHECQKLCDEHSGLLDKVDDLRSADAETRANPGWGARVRAFLEDLDRHESRENEILIRALDGSMEAQD
ncbi:MAG: hemerythrin domain-containing protein [Acidobacteriota bacterium]|jgi:iron-sulfur cluster repair protein YtfE (RIC family)